MVIEMKKKWIAASLLVILIVVISAGFVLNQANKPESSQIDSASTTLPQNSNIAGSRSYQIVLNTPVPTYPEKILVYKTVPSTVSREILEEYAKKFNIVDGTFRDRSEAMSLQTKDFIYGVELDKKSGTVIYIVSRRPNDELDSPTKLPSDEEAVKIATQFLKERNLYPDNVFLRKIEREYTRFADQNGKEIPRNGVVVVWFGRTLNNLEVKGTQLDVEIGGNGEVIGYYATWRDYTPYKEYPLKSPQTAFEELKQQGIATGVAKPDTISIDSVTLAYATKAGAFKEDYLEPVWVFKGEAIANGSSVEQVSKSISALKEVPTELITQ
jgi:predicted small secreted protein